MYNLYYIEHITGAEIMNRFFWLVLSVVPVFFSCPAIAASSVSPVSISLQEALNISMEQNNEIKAAREQEEAARQALASARGLYYPRIDAEGRYTRLNDNINLDVNDVRTALIAANTATALAVSGNPAVAGAVHNALEAQLPQFNMRMQDKDYFNFTVSAVQTIYAGGRIHAANSAKKAALYNAERNTAATREKITAEVTEGYYRLKLAERVAAIRKEAREGIENHDNTAARLEEQGMISRASRMRAQVALADAEREETKSVRDKELASILLANLLAVESSSFTLTTDFGVPVRPEPVEFYINRAVSSNSTLNMLAGSSKQLKAARTAADGKRLPSLAAFGKYELYKHDLTALEPDWAAGLVLKIPIFSGLSDYRESREIEAKQQALDRLAENAREQIKTLVRKYHHDMLAAKEEYEALAKAEELAAENLRLNRISFEQGTGTSLDVIDAQLSLSRVRVDRCRTLFDYEKARAGLLRACGE